MDAHEYTPLDATSPAAATSPRLQAPPGTDAAAPAGGRTPQPTSTHVSVSSSPSSIEVDVSAVGMRSDQVADHLAGILLALVFLIMFWSWIFSGDPVPRMVSTVFWSCYAAHELATAVGLGLLRERLVVTRESFCVVKDMPQLQGKIPHWLVWCLGGNRSWEGSSSQLVGAQIHTKVVQSGQAGHQNIHTVELMEEVEGVDTIEFGATFRKFEMDWVVGEINSWLTEARASGDGIPAAPLMTPGRAAKPKGARSSVTRSPARITLLVRKAFPDGILGQAFRICGFAFIFNIMFAPVGYVLYFSATSDDVWWLRVIMAPSALVCIASAVCALVAVVAVPVTLLWRERLAIESVSGGYFRISEGVGVGKRIGLQHKPGGAQGKLEPHGNSNECQILEARVNTTAVEGGRVRTWIEVMNGGHVITRFGHGLRTLEQTWLVGEINAWLAETGSVEVDVEVCLALLKDP